MWKIRFTLTVILISTSIFAETFDPSINWFKKTETSKLIEIRWHAIDGAVSYRVKIETDDHTEIADRKTDKNFIEVYLEPGKYLAQIAAISKYGIQGDWSESWDVNVTMAKSEEEQNERITAIQKLAKRVNTASKENGASSPDLNPAELGLIGNNIIGLEFTYTLPVAALDPFQQFYGGALFFKYHKLFIKNLQPEIRIGYMYSPSAARADSSLTFTQLLAGIGYSIDLFKQSISISLAIGGGMNMTNLASGTFGKSYIVPAAYGNAEIDIHITSQINIFVKYGATYMHVETSNILFHSPGLGVSLRF